MLLHFIFNKYIITDFTYSDFLKNIILKWLKIVYSFFKLFCNYYLFKLNLLMDLIVTKVITVIAFTHARHKTNQVNNRL